MRSHLLKTVLDELNEASADIDTAAIVSSDGLMLASSLPSEQDQDRVGVSSATLLSIGSRLASDLGCGKLQQLVIKSELGYLIAAPSGLETILVAVVKAEAKPGMAVIDVLRAAETAELILKCAVASPKTSQ